MNAFEMYLEDLEKQHDSVWLKQKRKMLARDRRAIRAHRNLCNYTKQKLNQIMVIHSREDNNI